ncbi:MAG: ATP-grasp domain-containing protein [Thermodesulfobacteriota bacterium]
MTTKPRQAVALEAHLKHCQNVSTIGVRPNFSDYTPAEAEAIAAADKIYYPSTFYADMFAAMGKPIFPSIHTYRFVQDKIKQSALFAMCGIPHPRTRAFYGNHRKEKILSCFDFPCVGKIPRGSALGRGVYLLQTVGDLEHYLSLTKPAYIQQYLPIDRDMRIVVIGTKVACAYWRIAPPGEFRSNVGRGAEICLDPVSEQARGLALEIARKCGWNDVGLDLCVYEGQYYVLEGNMKYGRAGFRRAGVDYYQMMEEMIAHGQI